MGESNGDFWASVEEMQRNPSLRRSQQRFEYNVGEQALASQVLQNNNMPMTMNEEQNNRIRWPNEMFSSKERDVDQRLLNMASGAAEDISYLNRQQQQQNYRGQGDGFQNFGFNQGLSSENRFQNPFSFKNVPSINEEMPAHNRALHFEDASAFMKSMPGAHSLQAGPAASSNSLVDELKTLLVSNVEVRKAVLELYQNSETGNSKSVTENFDQVKKIDNGTRTSSVKETGSSLYERRNNDFSTRDKSEDGKRRPRSPRSRGSSPVRRRRSRSRSRSPVRRRDYRRSSRDRSRSSDRSSYKRHSKERDRKDLKRKNEDKLSADLEAKISKIIDQKSLKLEPRAENVVPAVEFGYNTQFSQQPSPHFQISTLNRNPAGIPRPALNHPIPSTHGNFPPPPMWQVNYQQQQELWNYRVPPPRMPPAPQPRMPSFQKEAWDYEPMHSNRASKVSVLVNVPLDGKNDVKKASKYYEPKTSELPKVMKLALEKGKDSRNASKSESKKSQPEAKKPQTESKAEVKKSQTEAKTVAKKWESKSDSKKPQPQSKKSAAKKSPVVSKTSSYKSGKNETVGKQTGNSKPPAKVKASVQSVIQLNLINKPDQKDDQHEKKSSSPSVSNSQLRNMRKKIRKKFSVGSCMYCGFNHVGRIDTLAYAIVKKNAETAFTKTVSPSESHNVNATNEEDSAVNNNKDDEIVVETIVDKNALKKSVEIVNISDDELEDHCAAEEEKTEIKAAADTEKLEDISSNEENEEKQPEFDFHGGSEDEFILLEEFKETEIEEISSEEEDCADDKLESAGINDEDFGIKEADKVTASIISDVLAQTISPVKEMTDKASSELIDAVDKPNLWESRVENIISDDEEMDIDAKSSVAKETADKLNDMLDQLIEKEVDSGNQESEISTEDQMKENEISPEDQMEENEISTEEQMEENENDENSNECEILEEEKEAAEGDVSMEQAEDAESPKVIENETCAAADEENGEKLDCIPIVTLNDEKCEDDERRVSESSKFAADNVIEVDGNCDENVGSNQVNEEVIKLYENSSEVVELEGEGTENTGYYLSEDAMKVLGSNIVDLVNDIEDKLMAEKKNISGDKKIEVIEVEDIEDSGGSNEPVDNTDEKDDAATKSSPVKVISSPSKENANESQIDGEESEVCEAQSESSSQVSTIALTVNSDLALDHFVAGSFERAMQLLHQQVGIINFVPYKSIIEKCVMATIPLTPEMPSYLVKTPLQMSFNMEDMVKRLQICYQAATMGVLEKATLLFRQLLRDTLLMKMDTKKGVAKARMLMKICRNYITCFTLETKKKDLDKNDIESEKRACELAAYATNCSLQPVHQILTLRIANSLYFKIGNFKTAAVFAKKILDAKPNAEIAEKTRKMLAICEKTPVDNVALDYHSERSFGICAGSLTPTYGSEEEIKCPLCQASYMPCFKGSLCNICNLAEVGKVCSGLKLVNDKVSAG